MKSVSLITAVLATALFFCGCDAQSSSEADRYDRQKSLDEGDYDRVLELTNACGGDQACLLDRAAAYMGLAGFDAPTIIKAVADSDDDSSDQGYFAKLKPYIKEDANNTLNHAKNTYESVIKVRSYSTASCADNVNSVLNKHEKDACANYGLSVLARSAVLANKITELYDQINASGCFTVSACFGNGTNDEAIVNGLLPDIIELVFNETDALIGMIADESADTKEEVQKIKDEICKNAGKPAGCSSSEVSADAALKYILDNRHKDK
ncbi:MAG: hypothetical protein LBO72_04975 [Helicobacteraceae bacterium]|jgi:hypothetical protein|nr:hypothetical protein [Helicobacteraceae bacterium]